MELRWLWHWLVFQRRSIDRRRSVETFPRDTLVQFNYLPTLRAQLALNRKNATQAIDTLQVAAPYDLAIAPTMGTLSLNLYPVYVRGQAYLAAHRGAEAAAEFKKILDQRGAVSNGLIGALAHLGLGRAHAVDSDIVRSRAAYQDFFALWKTRTPASPASLKPGLNTRD